MTLDGFKTGITVLDEVLKTDTKIYQNRSSEWKKTDEERVQFSACGQNENNLQRPHGLGQFIMDEFHNQAKEEKDLWLAEIESHFDARSC
jgi:RNA-dependent RNA polymerase